MFGSRWHDPRFSHVSARCASPGAVLLGLDIGLRASPTSYDSPCGPSTLAAFIQSNSTKDPTLANIKSQKKRILTNEKARQRNLAVKSELKTAVRQTREAIAAGDKAAAEAALKNANRKLDKAVSKGVVHQNQAANRKASIARQVAAL